MNILSIGTDRSIFIAGSEVGKRQIKQGEESGGRVEIIVFALRRLKLKTFDLSPKVRVIPTNSLSHWLYVFDAIRIGKKLARPNLVVSQDPFECGLVAWRLAGFFHAKLSLQIHTDFLSPHFVGHSLLNRLRIIISRWTLPRADSIRVVSERIKERIKKRGWKLKTIPFVQPIVVDVERIKNAPVISDLRKQYPRFEKIILMVSRLEPEKNIDMAIRSLKEILRKYPRAGLIIVGAGSELPLLKASVSKHGMESSIVFDGWRNHDIIYSYYKTADLFLNTSFYEGYNLTMTEAKAAGCKVLSPDVSGAREIGANIFEFNDESLTESIIRLIS